MLNPINEELERGDGTNRFLGSFCVSRTVYISAHSVVLKEKKKRLTS